MNKSNTVDGVFLVALLVLLVGAFIYINTLPAEEEGDEPEAEVIGDSSDSSGPSFDDVTVGSYDSMIVSPIALSTVTDTTVCG